jgi:hypothetical protein
MKKLSLFALAAAGLLLGACSDKDEIAQPVNSAEFKDGAFIGLSLQLPEADNSTRANDELSNGTADEFAVKNATLYIFKTAKNNANFDKEATFVDKVNLGNTYDPDKQGGIDPNDVWGVQDGVDETNITSTYNRATLISNELASTMKADNSNDYYAYVIVNHNGVITPAPTTSTTFEQFSNLTFNVIGADIAAKKNVWDTGLLMTNAPICSAGGGSDAPAATAKYSTLVKLDNTKIFNSQSAAEQSPAACVYVERAAVKITVEDGRTDEGKKLGGLDVTIKGWQVINNEPTFYNTRHINYDGAAAEDWGPYHTDVTGSIDNVTWPKANNLYRFVSKYAFNPSLPLNATHTDGYRTYFAKDVQYNADATLNNTVASDNRPWIEVGNTNHAYTTENTFDVKHQTWRNTTMVTLKVQIGDGTKGFYTVGKGSQVMYVDDADMTATGARYGKEKALAAIENIIKGDNDVASAMTALRTAISKNNPEQKVESGLTLEIPVAPEEGTTGVDFTVALDYTLAGAAYPAPGDDFVENTDPTKNEKALAEALEAAIAKAMWKDPADHSKGYADAVLLSFYKGGVSYYNVRIKHFGDYETPWSATGNHIAGGGDGVNEIYFGVPKTGTPTDAQVLTAQKRFLGRYGVVRDNWYKLSVDQIGKIGDAEPVDPSTTTPDTPDDEIENFIAVHVHIIPWVLRQQSVQF